MKEGAPASKPAKSGDFAIVGVGASAGGLEALREMFSGFDGQSGMAFVVVQHLDPTHESLMAQLLERYTPMAVKQAEGGEQLEPDHIYVIPPAHGLALNDGVLELTEFTEQRGMRRPIDDFFESLAKDQGERAACVILSGTGADGSRGLRAIKEHSGICIAQDPDTAAYDGMPTAAIGTGLVDITCDPRDTVEHLSKFFQRAGLADVVENDLEDADTLLDICDVLREAVGHDFSNYKRSTLNRRVARRMQVLGIEDTKAYLKHLQENGNECSALFSDLLINVTRFFRDTEHFKKLDELVISPMVEKAKNGEELRIWVPGCSSGEEAYSIAMLFADAAKRFDKRPYVQVFATDIDDKMLDIGRSGVYPLSSLQDIPKQFQDEYIYGSKEKFTIAPQIRDMVRFSVHNLVRDPPYSKIDLVACRNVLIYFDDSLQKLVFPLFHFATRESGYLFLGSSETIGRHEDLFEPVDQSSRIFRRKNVKGNYTLNLASDVSRQINRSRQRSNREEATRRGGVEVRALEKVAQRYAPVSLLLDREAMLLERWGSAGRYLDFPERLERSIHVPSLARPGLRELIGPMIRQVSNTGRRAIVKEVEIVTDFGTLEATVVCEPIDNQTFLFVVNETRGLEPDSGGDYDEFDPEDGERQFLEEELQATRHRLRSTVEELETTNEELKSSNEEMMSMNEELQSTNEELTTVNDELKNKVDQLTTANADLKNFFDSTKLAVLVVDSELKLRSFTDAAEDLFPLTKEHIGRSLATLPHNLDNDHFVDMAKSAAKQGLQVEEGMHSRALDRELVLQAIPYRLLDGELDGATLIFTDVSETLSLERDLREERERLRLALEVAKIGIWEYEPSTDKTVLDPTERILLDLDENDPGDTLEPIMASLPIEDRDRVNRALRMAMEGKSDFDEVFRLPLDDGETRYLHGLGKLIEISGTRKFIGVTFDVSSERRLLDQRDLMIREMNHRVKNLFSVISAMVSIAARDAEDVTSFAEGLRDRIHALGRSHSLTNEAGDPADGGIQLSKLVNTVLRPNLAGQDVAMTGPDTTIRNDQITSIALILHEWATNSTKYGALATRDGSIEIRWSEKEGEVAIDWREQGEAPGGTADSGPGFGTKLVRTAARQLRGDATGEPIDGGYRRTLKFQTE